MMAWLKRLKGMMKFSDGILVLYIYYLYDNHENELMNNTQIN